MQNNNYYLLFNFLIFYTCTMFSAAALDPVGPIAMQPESLPKIEYTKYMRIIQQHNLEAYEEIQKAEKKLGQECLIKALDSKEKGRISRTRENPGYPTIILPRNITFLPQKEKIAILLSLANCYTIIPDMTKDEREQIMDSLAEIAPKLQREIDNQDPLGSYHIQRSYKDNFARIGFSPHTGLPLLYIAKNFTKLDHEHQKFLLGHELGHYALKHHSKENQHLDSQSREYEADTFSVTTLRTDIEKAIHFTKTRAKGDKTNYQNTTHPSWKDRTKALEALLPTIDNLRDERDPEDISWKKIARKLLEEQE